MIEAEVQIVSDCWRSHMENPEAAARRAAAAVGDRPAARALRAAAKACGISIVLSDDSHVRGLNRDHRGQDRTTNVLAFPAAPVPAPNEDALFLGDVVLAFETVKREAEAQNKPLTNHMSHLIVHGTLHLLGYDHEDDRDAARMEAEEAAVLGRLGIPDPYVTDSAEEAGTATDG